MCFFLRKKTRLNQEKQNRFATLARVRATSMDGGFGLLLPDESEEDRESVVASRNERLALDFLLDHRRLLFHVSVSQAGEKLP